MTRAEHHGGRLGAALGLLLDQAVDAVLIGVTLSGLVPGARSVQLPCVHQGQLGHSCPRAGKHAAQQGLPMAGHALKRAGFEQVGGKGPGRPQAVGCLEGVQGQVELGTVVFAAQGLDIELRHLEAVTQLLVEQVAVGEHHLEQRIVAQAACRLQGFDQLLERQVLMLLGAQRGLAHLFQQRLYGQLPIEAPTQDLGIDEEADQTLGLQAMAVSDGHADTDVVLAAVALQQCLERGQQQHEQRDVVLLRQLLQARGQLRVQGQPQAGTAVALHGRTRVIGGQLQHHRLIAQLLTPVHQLTLAFTGCQPVALPVGVVQVLDGQRRKVRLRAACQAGIALHPFIDHHLHRPAIGNDVVLNQGQHVVLCPQFQHTDAQQRPIDQVERLGGLGLDKGLDQCALLVFARNGLHRHRQTPVGVDDRTNLGLLLDEGGAQAFVALHQQVEAVFQRLQVQLATQAQGHGDVIGAAVRLQLPQEPLPLLGERQLQRLVAVHGGNRCGAVALQSAHGLGKGVQGAVFEQQRQRHLQVQFLGNARNHLGGEQRVPAQVEEVIGHAYLVQVQHLAPDGCNGALELSARCLEGLPGLFQIRRRQGLAVQLAVGAQGHRRQPDQVRRHHVGRQGLGQSGLELGLPGC